MLAPSDLVVVGSLFYMPRFEVAISEAPPIVEPRSDDQGISSFVRAVHWGGEAADEPTAIAAAWLAWDKKYGPGRQPADAIVRVQS